MNKLEISIENNERNINFRGMNDQDKNLVINLGSKMLNKGMKDIQLWKNQEWEEKIVCMERKKDEEIEKMRLELNLTILKFQKQREDQRTEIECIKSEVLQQVKTMYDTKITNYEETIETCYKNLDEEKKNTWDLKESYHKTLNETTKGIREEEEGKRTRLRKEYDDLLTMEREKYIIFNKRQENSTLLGQDGEAFTYHKLNMLFPKSEVIDTHEEKQCGDFKLVYNNLPLLLEVKNYSGNVLKKEILKFKRDMEYRSEMKGGVFISLKSGIAACKDFQLEVYNGKPVIFLTYVKDDMEKIKLAVKFIETMVKENIDLKNEELVCGLKKLVPVIKRKCNSLKGTLENFKNKMNRDLLEQEANIIEIFKIIGMKY